MRHIARSIVPFCIAALAASVAPAVVASPPDGGVTVAAHDFTDAISPTQWAKLAAEASKNEKVLLAAGKLAPPATTRALSGLAWPLGPTPGRGLDWHGVSNFKDLDPAYPDQLRDYTCAARTYDNANGYNHGGTDFFIWPFPWHLMDTGAIDVVAAAPGVIVGKGDGNDDRSCSFNAPDTPNYVLVRHDDGTVGVYLHMKRGSVTTAAVGSPVAAGAVLGKVGSSGISTGPHLHFELRESTAGNAPAFDPFNGACNARASAWATQRPYRDSRLNRVATHTAAPVLGSCPNTVDMPNFGDRYAPGETAFFSVAYRDIVRGQPTQLRVIAPDGSVADTWTFDLADVAGSPLTYSGSLWYFQRALPANAPTGTWRFEATYNGETLATPFTVATGGTAIADFRGLTGAWFDPATSGQGFEFQWIEPGRLLVLFYGHRDNGENFFVIGTRDGPFAYGDTLDIALSATRGGRFNGFDPAAIIREPWGTLSLRFTSCGAATATLTGRDGTQSLALQPITRIPGLSCD